MSGANLGDTWHNGNSAGNKSLITYRMGVGVPGYTGFNPAEECVSIPVKAGCMTRAPLESLAAGRMANDGSAIVAKDQSTHKSDFTMTPEAFAEATAADYGWDPTKKKNVGDPPFVKRPPDDRERPFLGASTFRDAFGEIRERPLPSNVTRLGQLRPTTAANNAGEESSNPFYSTEYGMKSSQRLYATAAKFGGRGPPMVAGRPRSFVGLDKPKLRRELLSTSYRMDFGMFGDDPADKMPQDPSDFSKKATTADQMQGTTKGTYHPPGYTGFIPTATCNAHAVSQSKLENPRDNSGWQLSGLFQFPQNIPGFSGYRPKTSVNDVGPDRNPALTTSGRAAVQGTSGFEPGELGLSLSALARKKPQPSMHGIKAKILDEFFSQEAAGGNISDNGRHEAQIYYCKTRPYEGRSASIIKQPEQWARAY